MICRRNLLGAVALSVISGGWRRGGGLPPIINSAAYTNFIARTSGLDGTHTNAYQALLDGLTNDGLFNANGTTNYFDALYVFATQNQTTALLNLVGATFNLSITGSIVFTVDRGFSACGASDFFGSTVTGLAHYTTNDAHLSAWCNSLTSDGNPIVAITHSGIELSETTIRAQNAGNALLRINDNPSTAGIPVPNAQGFLLGNRSGSTARQAYKNGVSIVTYGSSPSGVYSGTLTFKGGAGDQIMASSIGGSVSATLQNKLYLRLNDFMQAVAGAPREGFWQQPMMSADGSKIYVPQFGGTISASTDGGVTWSVLTAAGAREWIFGWCSSDGSIIYVPDYTAGTVFKSSNSGATWAPLTIGGSSVFFAQAACSSDGSKVLVTNGADQGAGQVWLSTNSGSTFSDVGLGTAPWFGASMSGDGTKMTVTRGGASGAVFVSIDSGVTWNSKQTSGHPGDFPWAFYSRDGSTLFTSWANLGVFKSANNGTSFTNITPAGQTNFTNITSSADGSVIALAQGVGSMQSPWFSQNGGTSWTQETSFTIPSNSFQVVSDDGTKIISAAYIDYIYRSIDSGATFAKTSATGS